MFEDHEVGVAGGLPNGCAISGCGTYLSGIGIYGILLKPESFSACGLAWWFGAFGGLDS